MYATMNASDAKTERAREREGRERERKGEEES